MKDGEILHSNIEPILEKKFPLNQIIITSRSFEQDI